MDADITVRLPATLPAIVSQAKGGAQEGGQDDEWMHAKASGVLPTCKAPRSAWGSLPYEISLKPEERMHLWPFERSAEAHQLGRKVCRQSCINAFVCRLDLHLANGAAILCCLCEERLLQWALL